MKYTLSITALMVALSAAPALSNSIHAGSSSGSYTNAFCPQVETAIKDAYFDHRCKVSKGSGDNVDKVTATPTDVGLGQFDVVAQRMDENPGALAMVDPGMGLECLYAVTSDSNVTRLSGLSARMPVALPPQKSGSTGTFKYLQTMDDSLASMRKIKYYSSALDAVNAVVTRQAALAFFVQFADTQNDVFKAVNDAKLTFVPVINRKILRREVGGVKVYQPQKVNVTPQGWVSRIKGEETPTIDTTCTPVVLFTGNPELMEGDARLDQEELVKSLANTKAPTKGDWTDILKNAVSYSQDQIDALVDKYK